MVTKALEAGQEVTDADLAVMAGVERELTEFAKAVAAGVKK